MTAQSSSNKSSQKREDSGKKGTATGHQQKVLNRGTQELKQLLHEHKNANIQTFLHTYGKFI
jgi:hypothetical protein